MGEVKSLLVGLSPPALVRHYAKDSEYPTLPQVDNLKGAVLFLDISGFTKLTEALAEEGAKGIEQLTVVLNEHFGKLIRVVSDSAGEVCAFAGDAFAAVWPSGIAGDSLREVCKRAAACALAMQELRAVMEKRHQTKLSFKIGVGLGNIDMSHLGGVADHWVLLFQGTGILDAINAQECALPGDCVLSSKVLEYIRNDCTIKDERDGYAKLKDLSAPPPMRLQDAEDVSLEAHKALECYLARTVLSRLAVGQGEWLGELRRISVMFLNLPDMKPGTSFTQQQEIFHPVQEVITKFGGTVNKLSIDEKGVSVLAVMGLPPNVYVDSPIRMIRAALSLIEVFRSRNFKCSIGITSGKAYCGVIGSRTRREYTVMGDVVNVAARLMGAAKGGLLCDLTTRNAGREVIQFDALPRIKLKGKAHAVAIFRPQKEIIKHQEKKTLQTIGRKRERTFFERRLKALSSGNPGGVLALEGPAGVGKSHLCAMVSELAQETHIPMWRSFSSVVEQATPFYPIRSVLESILGFRGGDGNRQEGQKIWDQLLKNLEFQQRAPVLNDIFDTGLKETDITRQFSGDVRREYIRRIVISVFRQALGSEQRAVLAIEDTQWMDSASWSLLLSLVTSLPKLLVVFTTRDVNVPAHKACRDFWANQKAKRIKIANLGQEETGELVGHCLGTRKVSSNVVEFVHKNTSGNPFYVQELSFALRDGRYVNLSEGEASASEDTGGLESLSFPDTIHGIVSSRIDRLPPQHQMTLKVASVIGPKFSVDVIKQVHPMEQDRPLVPRYLEYLIEMGFLRFDEARLATSYVFSHAITQEVAYELMLYDQRRKLHKGIALWYEKHSDKLAATNYPILAHHWYEAGDLVQTITYLEKSGDLAYSTGAFSEAVGNYQRALELAGNKLPGERASSIKLRRARWNRKLADAYYGLGTLDDALTHSREALTLLGERIPSTPMGWKVSTLKSRLVGKKYNGQIPKFPKKVSNKDKLVEASQAARRFAECSYRNQDYASMVGASWLSVRFGEKAGGYAGIALSYAMLGMGYGVHAEEASANSLFETAKKMAMKNSRPMDFVFAVQNLANYRIGVGSWTGLKTVLSEAVDLVTVYGTDYDSETILLAQGHLAYLTGQLGLAMRLFQDVTKTASDRSNEQHEIWALNAQATACIGMGKFDIATRLLNDSQKLLGKNGEKISTIVCFGALGLTRLRGGNLQGARLAADAAWKRMEDAPTSFEVIYGYIGVIEVYLDLWLRAVIARSKDAPKLGRRAKGACDCIRRYAELFPVGQSLVHLYEGRIAVYQGDSKAGKKSLIKGLEECRRMQLPYFEGLALYELILCPAVPEAQSRTYYKTARELFWRVGSTYYTERLDAYRKTQLGTR